MKVTNLLIVHDDIFSMGFVSVKAKSIRIKKPRTIYVGKF